MIDLDKIRIFSEINMVEEFIIENIDRDIQGLNGEIRKKFTSLATNATLFRWKFGDTQQNSIIETTENPYYHTFISPGTYQVSHQSCYPCDGQLTCSSGWCTKAVIVEAIPKSSIVPLVVTAGLFFLILPKKKCEDYDNKKDCKKHDCQWLEEEKKCVGKCTKGYNLEKVRTGDIKRPFRLKCVPEKSQKI